MRAFSRSLLPLGLLSLVAVGACDSDSNSPPAGGAGSGGSGGSTGGKGGKGGGSGGSGGSGGFAAVTGEAGAPDGLSDLPEPPGEDDVEAPSGGDANLRVLPWAGFTAAVSYTFDDSQPSQIEHWAALRDTGVRMTHYINTSNNWISGYNVAFQEAVVEGHEIGNHTAHHCHVSDIGTNSTACSGALPTMAEEIDSCSDYIVTQFGQAAVWTFAYPFGETGYKMAAQERFFLARGVNSGSVAPGGATDPYNLPAIAHAGNDPVETFNADIDTAVSQGRWIIYLFHSILPTSNNWYAGEDIASITGSIDHAKDLGTVWLDSVVNVGAYWLGQRLLESAETTTDGDATTWTWRLPPLFPPNRWLRVTVDGGTLSQDGEPLAWDSHGYYEVSLDLGTLTWTP